MRDEEKSDAEFALKRFQFALHLLAEIGVERGKRLVEEKELRAIDEGAGQGDALLLAAAETRRSGIGVFVHFDHAEGGIDARGNFGGGSVGDAKTVSDIFARRRDAGRARSAGRRYLRGVCREEACRGARRSSRFRRR